MLLVAFAYLGRMPGGEVTPSFEAAAAEAPAPRGAALSDGPSARPAKAPPAKAQSKEVALGFGGAAVLSDGPVGAPTSAPPTSTPPTTTVRVNPTVATPSPTTATTAVPATDPPRPAPTVTTEPPPPLTTRVSTTTTTTPPTTSTTVPPTTTTVIIPINLLVNPAPASAHSHRQDGVASWYRAADGSCAHRDAPRGTVLKVTRVRTGQSVTCVVSDWGPEDSGRVIDLSDDTFLKLAALEAGLIDVIVEW